MLFGHIYRIVKKLFDNRGYSRPTSANASKKAMQELANEIVSGFEAAKNLEVFPQRRWPSERSVSSVHDTKVVFDLKIPTNLEKKCFDDFFNRH